MKKLFIEGFAIVALFLITLCCLSQVDWISLFRIQQITDKTEQKLGELLWKTFKETDQEVKDARILESIDSLVTHLCDANNISRDDLKVHVLRNSEINAFALPDGHFVVYTGLIHNAENQEELAGVIGHEMAHIELNHVMKKLGKEIGLSALIAMTTGNVGTEVIRETARTLSSTAFDRSFEKEADIKAVDYLLKANIDPEPFGKFLHRLSDGESKLSKYLTWISTHPESKERAKYVHKYRQGKGKNFESVLSAETWKAVKEGVGF